ncbi:4-(cytidine 5'-diphospho)-2-C-methyl-D-erythritol kinase [Halalkalibacillus sediminis]|uniref:4-diphosphocytidyl-2-C-methyl-D-erythritol kinase n=1 Tax=Halalkalibacillus sediminis TaxID=2018042 RepID=A0A2I0QT34_9BACI|nr:4-(cytidine 5'-diphospho)-2-C-methyl-D-erythritol kinase [Halalkalibacillus sediminis]PKR77497.1 4-(cytidine 5'-diphospho)-2-C-methyl-D-erythritol kinase [Halalkalibacillus sediminis]
MIYEKAPAKINLTLDILHKRTDGYHEVEMIMTTIDLSDRLSFEKRGDQKILIESDNRFVPNDKRNLVYQAADLMIRKYELSQGVTIHMDKNIPVAAGLAGGSSDAAATLRGVNRLFELGLTSGELQELGATLGSDVPFCVTGGTALATGRGEKLKPLPALPPCWVVLGKPSVGVSTKEVYGKVNFEQMKHPQTEEAIHALEQQDFYEVCDHLENVLEPITVRMHGEISRIKSRMEQAGGDGVLMSGSGPTVFALSAHQSRAEGIYNSLKGFCSEVYIVRNLR